MPSAQEIRADVFTAPEEIARGFFLVSWNMNRRQGASAIQHRELTGIAPIRLDAIAGRRGIKRRRDDVARNLLRVNARCSSKPHGPGLVTAGHRALAPTVHEPHDRGLSDVSEWSAGVRWPGNNTAATVVAAC